MTCRSNWRALALGVIVLAALGGCGQKGPLYLPNAKKSKVPAPATPAPPQQPANPSPAPPAATGAPPA